MVFPAPVAGHRQAALRGVRQVVLRPQGAAHQAAGLGPSPIPVAHTPGGVQGGGQAGRQAGLGQSRVQRSREEQRRGSIAGQRNAVQYSTNEQYSTAQYTPIEMPASKGRLYSLLQQ